MILVEKCWYIFLKKKSDAFIVFLKFKPFVEKDSRKSIITLKSDNGGKLYSNEFSIFLDTHGIEAN